MRFGGVTFPLLCFWIVYFGSCCWWGVWVRGRLLFWSKSCLIRFPFFWFFFRTGHRIGKFIIFTLHSFFLHRILIWIFPKCMVCCLFSKNSNFYTHHLDFRPPLSTPSHEGSPALCSRRCWWKWVAFLVCFFRLWCLLAIT